MSFKLKIITITQKTLIYQLEKQFVNLNNILNSVKNLDLNEYSLRTAFDAYI